MAFLTDMCPNCQHNKHLDVDCTWNSQTTDDRCMCKAADTRKATTGKVKGWSLIPWDVIGELADIYEYGRLKYLANSWQQVQDGEEKYFEAMMRHIAAYRGGEVYDPESKKRHVAHVLWNAVALCFLSRK